MINDLPTHSVIPSKKSNCSEYPGCVRKYKSGCTGLPCSRYMRSFIVSGSSRQIVSALENTRSSQSGLSKWIWLQTATVPIKSWHAHRKMVARMAKKWQNSGFVAKFLTKFALF